MIRSVLLVIAGALVTGFLAGFVVVMSRIFAWDENRVHRLARLWAKIMLFLSNTRVEVTGSENILVDSPQIFMSNHQSVFDIFIALAHVPCQFRWIAKKELFKVPVFGPAMRRAGCVEIDRQSRPSAIKSLDEAAQKIKEGKSVITFPEGTRSKDGRIKHFKKGVFYLAIKSGVPVIPVSITGSREIMAKKSLTVHRGKITVIIDKPVDAKNYSIETRDKFVAKVRDVIIRNYHDGMTVPEGKENP